MTPEQMTALYIDFLLAVKDAIDLPIEMTKEAEGVVVHPYDPVLVRKFADLHKMPVAKALDFIETVHTVGDESVEFNRALDMIDAIEAGAAKNGMEFRAFAEELLKGANVHDAGHG